jgi:hypothetical protein
MPMLIMFRIFWLAPLIVWQIAIDEAIDPSKKPVMKLIVGGRAER